MPFKDPIQKKIYQAKWWVSEAGLKYRESVRELKNQQHKKYRKSPKGKIVSINTAKRMREKYPEKHSARAKLRYAVKVGKVKRLPCEECGDVKSHGHHPDYSKPLEVIWLCITHHRQKHDNKC